MIFHVIGSIIRDKRNECKLSITDQRPMVVPTSWHTPQRHILRAIVIPYQNIAGLPLQLSYRIFRIAIKTYPNDIVAAANDVVIKLQDLLIDSEFEPSAPSQL